MPQLRTELAPTVTLLAQYGNALREALHRAARTDKEALLRFAAGIDLLQIIVQLMVVSGEAAGEISKECRDFNPKFRLDFVRFLSHYISAHRSSIGTLTSWKHMKGSEY